MTELFLDTNVIIDFLIDRKPFSMHAAKLFAKAEKKELIICIAALSLSNIFYVM